MATSINELEHLRIAAANATNLCNLNATHTHTHLAVLLQMMMTMMMRRGDEIASQTEVVVVVV